MIESLSGLFAALREEGVRVSPGEAIDAVRALGAVGIESRPAVHAALRLTCAKDRRSRERFERVFERWFRAPERRAIRGPAGPGSGQSGEAAGGGAGGATGDRPRPAPPDPDASPGPAPAPARSARPAPPSEPRPPRERPPGERSPTKPLARPGEKRAGPPSGELPLALQLQADARKAGSRLRRVVLEPPAARAEVSEPGRTPIGREWLRRDGRSPVPVPAAGERELAEQLARLIAELRIAPGRRYRAGRRGRFSARRTLRDMMATFGVPFLLRHQRRRPRRPRLLVLMDVSWSVERAAGLFLRLSASFLERAARTRIIAFVDRPVECTRALLAWAGRAGTGAPSFAEVLDGLDGLDRRGASDFGRVFYTLLGDRRTGARDRILVVLGDGRSNRHDPLGWAFAELAARARAAVWLVPEPHARWGTGDSALGEYLPHASVAVEVADLAGLARGLAELRRAVTG